MKTNERYEKYGKEYIINYQELKKILGIEEEIDHLWISGGNELGVVTKWVKTTHGESQN